MMRYKYIKKYLDIIIEEYGKWDIGINQSKTSIIFNTDNKIMRNYAEKELSTFNLEFNGNIIYVGVASGNDEFICEHLNKLYMKLQKKLLHIDLINSRHQKLIMLRRFMDYNKIIYTLKTTRIIDKWVDKLEIIYQYINDSITAYINYHPTMEFQISMTRKRGGLGLRSPKQFYPATKITSLSNKIDKIKKFFKFDDIEDMESNIHKQIYNNKQQKYIQYLDKMIREFNNYLEPDLCYIHNENVKHKDLLELIDKKLLLDYYKIATKRDIARIKSLAVNGATSWMDIMPNNIYGVEYNNQEYWVLLSLFLGADIDVKAKICAKCKGEMDAKGYHSLHCKFGPQLIQRHNAITDTLQQQMEYGRYQTLREQKYTMNEDGKWEEFNGIPGDLVVKEWNKNQNQHYFDVVVGNIVAECYYLDAEKEQLFLAKVKEKQKRDKYDIKNFTPLAMEVMGAVGPEFRRTLQKLARVIGFKKKKKYENVMNQIRKKLIAVLMRENAKLIISSLPY